MHGMFGAPRSFLFLQGMASRFFDRLGRELANRGHEVRRINFNGGDRVFWRLPGAVDYRGGAAEWPEFLLRRLNEWRVTDIILFGDCRPLHRAAIKLAVPRGIAVQVFEEGYLRPNWVTLEAGGVNGNSSLTRDPEWFRAAAAALPPWDGGVPVRNSYFRRCVEDVLYTGSTLLLAWRYPGYRTHRPWHPMVEYLHGARQFLCGPLAKRRAARMRARIVAGGQPYYIFPLQLDSDSQISHHSPFGGMLPAIEQVVGSFSRHAPADALLVITGHPLDTGVRDWRAACRGIAARAGAERRILYLDGGSPEDLLERSRGVVTVNSTVGILALTFARPVVALGDAIYDMPALTFRGGLDEFWTHGTPPDAGAFDAFRRVIAARTQVNGGFFSAAGLALAVAGATARLEGAAGIERSDRRLPLAARAAAEEFVGLPAPASRG